jgi:hypothetical protein
MTNTMKIGEAKVRIYGCKIWDDDELVREYIPVIDAQGTTCLYDLVSNEYFYGSSNYIAGPKVTEDTVMDVVVQEEEVDTESAEVEEPVTGLGETENSAVEEEETEGIDELVTETQEVDESVIEDAEVEEPAIETEETEAPAIETEETEAPATEIEETEELEETEAEGEKVVAEAVVTTVSYIEITTNGAGIDTGYLANSETSISLDMAIIEENNYGNFIKGYDNSCNRLTFRQEGGNGLYVGYGWYNSRVYIPEVLEVFNISQVGNLTYINDELVRTARLQSYQMTDTLKIGATKGRIYGCKIWEGDQLIRDYIPVLDLDGEPCLYDQISCEYYYGY